MMGAGHSSRKIVVVSRISATCLDDYYEPSWASTLSPTQAIEFVPEPRPKQYWKNRFERIGRKRGNTR